MSATYFKFLFINTIKKKPIWITSFFFLFTIACFLIIIPGIARINTLQLWANTTMMVCQSILSLITALYTAVLAINIFQDNKDEGTDLIIISKPLSRKKVIISKFLVFATISLMLNLLSVFVSLFTIFLPTTEIKYYWGLLISLFIGNTVSIAIFGSIAILLASKVNKSGVIVINLLISIIFFVYQIIALFVITSPSKKLIENNTPATTYTVTKRNMDTGTYQEKQIVRFDFGSKFQNQEYPVSTWQDVKKYWTDVVNSTSTDIVNATEFASQIGSTYLSIGIDKYSDRFSQRIFGSSSRLYNYNLISPASPEITTDLNDKESIDFLYCLLDDNDNESIFKIPASTVSIFQPARIIIQAADFSSASALRGWSNSIPVGWIKSKEFNSSHDIFLEQEQFLKYKADFDILYENVFRPDLLDINNNPYYEELDKLNYINDYRVVFRNNNNIKKFFDLLWACFTNSLSKYISKDSFDYSPINLEITTINDLNERLIQFKYYTLLKATKTQQSLIANGYTGSDEEYVAKQLTKEISTVYNYTNIEHVDDTWYMRYSYKYNLFDYIEPDTQVVSSQWLNDCWDETNKIISDYESSKQKTIAHNSAKYKIEQCGYIAKHFALPKEKYLYLSLSDPTRTSNETGDTFCFTMDWIPYIKSEVMKYLTPMGQNLSLFYYNTTKKTNFWWFIVIWLGVSIILTSGGIIVYNKYDIK